MLYEIWGQYAGLYNVFPATFNYSGRNIKKTDYVHLEFEFCKKSTMEEKRNNIVEAMIIVMYFCL